MQLSAPADSVVARTLRVLDGLPDDPAWVLVGGIAVFLRLGSVTRPTADADAVARSQAAFVDHLASTESVEVVSAGKLLIETPHGVAKVDVMDLADDPVPLVEDRRMFALARRAALASAVRTDIVVRDAGLEAVIPIAGVAALTALKTVAVVRRPHGRYPSKVGADIHDLVRLTATGAERIAEELTALDRELAAWVAGRIDHYFADDIRLTMKRLRLYDRSPGALALNDEAVAATAALADAIADRLRT